MPVTIVNFNHGNLFVNSVYADANLLCYARNRLSPYYKTATTIIGDLIVQKVPLFVSHLVIDEVWWAFLRAWYRYRTGTVLTSQKYKNNPSILGRFSKLLERNTNKILSLPNVKMASAAQPLDVVQIARDIFTSESLMPRDCFHLAFVMANNIEGFVTSDRDFDNLNLPNYPLTVYRY